MGELLVLLVCWKSGPYGVPDQQGDLRLINLKGDIDYFFSKGPKSNRTDRTQKRRSFRVNSILSFCHYVKHETQHVGQLISIKRHTI